MKSIQSCFYCNNEHKEKQDLRCGDTFIVEPAKFTYTGDGMLYAIPLNYCPNCGRYIKIDHIISFRENVEYIKKRLAQYDRSHSKEDKLKFVSEIASKFGLSNTEAIKLIRQARKLKLCNTNNI